jgi:Spy/CpxP family protein refolding chaperone
MHKDLRSDPIPTLQSEDVMKKMAVLAAFAAMASVSVAQAQSAEAHRQHQVADSTHARFDRGRPRGPGALLKGITLSADQKAKLKELHKGQRADGKQKGATERPDFNAIREARQKGDTATAKRLMREQREKMEARRTQEYAAIRAILTPDQRTQFDANVTEMAKRQKEHGGRGGRKLGR